MRKILFFILLMVILSAPVFCDENWKAILNFSINGKYDMLPIVLSTYDETQDIVKPPPLPGLSQTTNPDDATLNVSVRSGNKYMQTSVVGPTEVGVKPDGTTENTYYWELILNSEISANNINVEAEIASSYKLMLIDPNLSGDHVTPYPVVNGNNQFAVQVSPNEPKVLYAMIGDAQSFAYSDSSGVVRGNVKTRGMDGINAEYDYSGVNVYIVEPDGSLTLRDSADSDGNYEFAITGQGTYKIQIVGDMLLSTKADIFIPESGHNFSVYQDMFGGDSNNDGEVEFYDFKILKICYKLNSCADPDNKWTDELADRGYNFDCSKANYDGKSVQSTTNDQLCREIGFDDFKVLKNGYKRKFDQ